MTSKEFQPRLIVLMGVAGSGKTTLGRLLAERLDHAFIDADDFHSTEAIALMRSGQPLPEETRDAWVERLLEALARRQKDAAGIVLAFSGLRARHRHRLQQLPFAMRMFMLQGSRHLLAERLAQRTGHFMPATQLQPQLAAMQPLDSDEPVALVDIDAFSSDREAILAHIMQALRE